MPCRARARSRITSLARVAEDVDERVIAADELEPAEGPTDLWALELTLEPRAGGVPPALAREIVTRGLTVRDCSPQGPFWRAVVTA